jgi:hypothetical protein
MACHIVQTRGAVFALWGDPEPQDATKVLDAVKKARTETGEKVLYVTRVPPGAPTPSGPARQAMNKILPEVISMCSSYHVVLEGDGFMAAFKRGVLLGLLQPVWKPRLFYVHATCSDVLRDVTTTEVSTASELLRAADKAGIVKGTVSLAAPKVA